MQRLLLAAGFIISILMLFTISVDAQEEKQDSDNITLTVLFNEIVTTPNAGKLLLDDALEVLRNETDTKIYINYIEFSSDNSTRDEIINLLSSQTPIDVITVDQIWLGELAQRGLLTDLTRYTEEQWNREGDEDWYFENWEGGKYQGEVYGIWAWTDVRGIWYWKDMLEEAGVDPESLKTWDGYITAAKKLNSALNRKGVQGVHLTGASHSPDLFYPYLWMLGGEILQQRDEHPTKGTYWFPVYNGTEGVKALEFIKEQIDSGIKPQKEHFWGKEFLDRKFAIMIEGSWMPKEFGQDFENRIGFIPMFPVPYETNQTSTLMGGWEFSIPITSPHKDLAWKLIALMVEPEILGPWMLDHSLLPTQVTIGEGERRLVGSASFPYYDEMISVIPFGGSRPSIPEYPLIAHHIKEALDAVYDHTRDPKEALDVAATKSAKILGWVSER